MSGRVWQLLISAALAFAVPILAGPLVTPGLSGVAAQTDCTYPILSLEQIAQRAPVIVLAEATRERSDGAGDFSTTLKVLSALKGRTTTPIINIGNLGHLASDCQGGPRLLRGERFVLFLNSSGTDPNVIWSIVNAEGGVYQVSDDGVQFPPKLPGESTQLVDIPPAEFVRDVGVNLLGDDPGRIEALIQQAALAETTTTEAQAVLRPVVLPQKPWYERLPRQQTLMVIAGSAIMLASVVYLVWRPKEPNPYRRP